MSDLHIGPVVFDGDAIEASNDSSAIRSSSVTIVGTMTLSVSDKVVLHAHEAKTFFARLRGLHAHLPLANHEALIISRCNAVHTYTMSQAIDVAFVDRSGKVLDARTLQPRRCGSVKDAVAVVEMNAGLCGALDIIPGVCLKRETGSWQ